MFNALLVQPLANGLVLFYKLLGGNMGVAIIAFSIFLKLVLHPLTRQSLENMKKMNDLKPGLEKLKLKHKGDRTKLMKAQSDFYKEKGFNPGAGCLPQIVQLVVLYAFFGVFNRILVPNANIIEKLNPLLYEPLKFASHEVINTQFLYLDITKPDTFKISGIPFAIPGLFLIASAIAQFVSVKIMSPVIAKEKKIAKKTKDDTDDALVASQQYSMYFLPVLTLLFGMQFASGLALYWLVFSAIQTYQQYRISGWGGLTPLLTRAGLLAK